MSLHSYSNDGANHFDRIKSNWKIVAGSVCPYK